MPNTKAQSQAEGSSNHVSQLVESMQTVLPDMAIDTTTCNNLRSLAKQFLLACELQDVKEVRRARNSIIPLGPGAFPSENRGNTPIAELGLKESTLRVLSKIVVLWYEDTDMPGRATWVSNGIDTVEALAWICPDSLQRQIESVSKLNAKNLLLEIEEKLHRRGFKLDSRTNNWGSFACASDEYEFTADSDACDLNCRLHFAAALEANKILHEDLALLPGISAPTVVVLKRIPVFDYGTRSLRQVQSIGDFMQLDFDVNVELPDCGIDIYTVANFLFSYGLAFAVRSSEAPDELKISKVAPLANDTNLSELLSLTYD